MTIPPIQPPTDPNNQPSPTEFDVLRQQLGQIASVVGELSNRMNAAPAPSPMKPLSVNPDDWQDPSKQPEIIEQIISRRVEAAIAPLNDFQKMFKRQQDYHTLKHQVKLINPLYTKLWDKIEPQLDQTFASGNIDVNIQIVAFQAQAILGGLLASNPNLLAAPAPSMIPPSGAPPKGSDLNDDGKPKLRELTPEEEQVRKMQGLSHEDYLKLQEGGSMLLSPRERKAGK